jgi:hypothetical protein
LGRAWSFLEATTRVLLCGDHWPLELFVGHTGKTGICIRLLVVPKAPLHSRGSEDFSRLMLPCLIFPVSNYFESSVWSDARKFHGWPGGGEFGCLAKDGKAGVGWDGILIGSEWTGPSREPAASREVPVPGRSRGLVSVGCRNTGLETEGISVSRQRSCTGANKCGSGNGAGFGRSLFGRRTSLKGAVKWSVETEELSGASVIDGLPF